MKLALYITNKLYHRKCFVWILFTRCKTLETHLFVSKVLRLVNKNQYGALSMKKSIYTSQLKIEQYMDASLRLNCKMLQIPVICI